MLTLKVHHTVLCKSSSYMNRMKDRKKELTNTLLQEPLDKFFLLRVVLSVWVVGIEELFVEDLPDI